MPVESNKTAVLRNVSNTEEWQKKYKSEPKAWDGRHDGQYLTCDPGDTLTLKENVAKGFIGDWDIEDEDLLRVEKKRVSEVGKAYDLIVEKDEDGNITKTIPKAALLELVKVVEPPEGPLPEEYEKHLEPKTVLKQSSEPEFPDRPAARKARKK